MLMGVTGASTPRGQCVDDIFAPIKSKMKVLKKFKKKMGLAPRSGSSSGTNNLPPILFHQVHGDNIKLSRDGTVARRAESFCKGVTFSSRPIKVSEKVCVKFLEISNNWSGVIRFGFTCNDPNNLRNGLPKYACPDLTNKPGYWAKALAERFAERDTVLFYYVTHAGDVHFGVNGEEKGIFFSGVETRGPLWAIMDVYGNSTAIELVDPRQQLNNSKRNLLSNGDGSPDMVDHILPNLNSLSIRQPPNHLPHNHTASEDVEIGGRRLRHSVNLSPLSFHTTCGRNTCLSNDRTIAARTDTEFCHGYVFTSRPIHLGEKIIVHVLATEPMYLGALAFGLTACDPATIQGADLPDDSEALLDRSEYWVISKDVANSPQRGDELSFCVTPFGEVQFSRNGSTPVVFMHVDHTLRLWAFFDVYGSTQKIRILGSVMEQLPAHPSRAPRNSPPRLAEPSVNRLRVNLPCTTAASSQSEISAAVVPARFCCAAQVPVTTTTPELVQYPSPGCGGGTVLVVNLPPPHTSYLSQQNQQNQHSSTPLPPVPTNHQPSSSGTLMSTYSHTYIEPISSSYSTLDSTTSMQQWIDASSVSGGTECTICYERPIDSVLYMCGHMCMCYECAVQQWRGKGGGHCPLCRAIIRDVIRTYKS